MLQLWLTCGLIRGSSLFGWAGMCWVGISDTMFRTSLGRVLCRLRLLWGESPFFCTCICYFCGSGFFVFLLLLVVVVCWMVRLHGTNLVGRLFYDGQRGFEACWVTARSCYCFHQIGMIAFIKLRHPLSFLPRELRENRGTCVCLSCFLSKNGNNNGFDTICLNSSLSDYKRVAKIHFTLYFALFSLVALV